VYKFSVVKKLFAAVEHICQFITYVMIVVFFNYERKLKRYFFGLKIFKFYWDLNIATGGREKIQVCIN